MNTIKNILFILMAGIVAIYLAPVLIELIALGMIQLAIAGLLLFLIVKSLFATHSDESDKYR